MTIGEFKSMVDEMVEFPKYQEMLIAEISHAANLDARWAPNAQQWVLDRLAKKFPNDNIMADLRPAILSKSQNPESSWTDCGLTRDYLNAEERRAARRAAVEA